MPVWVRAAIFIAIVPGAAAGWIPRLIAGPNASPPDAPVALRLVGGFIAMVGWALLFWCARDFAVRGRGTPAPYDPPRALVTEGLYRFVRNPMYVAVVVAILGQALLYWSRNVIWYGVFMALVFHVRIILFEEPRLTQLFGESFVQYRARVPRWLPRPPR
jgi:protein-S-isoprenylcysteine O-methyltransferase Ste14